MQFMLLFCTKNNNVNKLQQFFSDDWAMARHELDTRLSLMLPAIIKGNIAEAASHIEKSSCEVKAVASPYLADWYELDDIALPVDSIAVISLTGDLYSWETDRTIRAIEAAVANPNICGIVFVIDGPGGMVNHLDAAAAAIQQCPKPTATVVTGTMASAHFWLGTATDHSFIASQLCEVGSVGVLTTYCSYKKYLEMNGIDYRVIYPDTADLKNKATRAIDDNGDETLLKKRLERIHGVFCETVARNLGIEYDPELPLFRGEMFTAEEAVKLGYIDEFGSIADAVKWVLAQATVSAASLFN